MPLTDSVLIEVPAPVARIDVGVRHDVVHPPRNMGILRYLQCFERGGRANGGTTGGKEDLETRLPLQQHFRMDRVLRHGHLLNGLQPPIRPSREVDAQPMLSSDHGHPKGEDVLQGQVQPALLGVHQLRVLVHGWDEGARQDLGISPLSNERRRRRCPVQGRPLTLLELSSPFSNPRKLRAN